MRSSMDEKRKGGDGRIAGYGTRSVAAKQLK
jgi:hypothetical protein